MTKSIEELEAENQRLRDLVVSLSATLLRTIASTLVKEFRAARADAGDLLRVAEKCFQCARLPGLEREVAEHLEAVGQEFMRAPELNQVREESGKLKDAVRTLPNSFPGDDLLTDRERAVLAQIVRGASSREAGRILGVSPRTIDFHRSNIMQKLGARNLADLVRIVLGE